MNTHWRVGITRDILDSRGEPAFGRAALAELDRASAIAWEYLPEVVPAITPEHAAQYDALYVNAARVPATAVARADCRLGVVARHGVGYDTVDIPAMTAAGVLVTHTPSAMPRPSPRPAPVTMATRGTRRRISASRRSTSSAT